MPLSKSPKGGEPWKCSDELAQKKGILNTVYSINGDEYTGEWMNNKKHGIEIRVLSCMLELISANNVSLAISPCSKLYRYNSVDKLICK